MHQNWFRMARWKFWGIILVTKKINDFIEQLDENFESITHGYFEEFIGKMKNRLRIP